MRDVDGSNGTDPGATTPPTDAVPTDAVPTDAVPIDAVPTDAVPTDAVPTDAPASGAPGVPGPPRGRRRRVAGGSLRERIEGRSSAERSTTVRTRVRGMLQLSGDVILLLKDLARDPRVLQDSSFSPAGVALVYLASPIDLVPDWIPVLGQLDDLLVVGWAVRRLLVAAGYDVIYELWRGSDEGLTTLLAFAGVQE